MFWKFCYFEVAEVSSSSVRSCSDCSAKIVQWSMPSVKSTLDVSKLSSDPLKFCSIVKHPRHKKLLRRYRTLTNLNWIFCVALLEYSCHADYLGGIEVWQILIEYFTSMKHFWHICDIWRIERLTDLDWRFCNDKTNLTCSLRWNCWKKVPDLNWTMHIHTQTFLTYVCCIPCIPFKWFIETKTKTVKGFREVCDLRETSLFANLEPINMFTIRLRFGISESLGVCVCVCVCVGVGRWSGRR